jgi:hypothetical protein
MMNEISKESDTCCHIRASSGNSTEAIAQESIGWIASFGCTY